MTHLRILQSDSAIEQVSSAVISKLYELATSGDLDLTSDLVGRINASATYQDYIDGIRAEYPELYISADKYYVKFNDPAFQKACALLYGDGVGMTMADFLAVTDNSPYYSFNGNTEITDMTEFKYFVNTPSVLDSNGHHLLFDILNLRNIEFPNHVTKIAWATAEDPYDNTYHYYRMFYRTTNLQNVKFPNSITSLAIANSPRILDLRNTSLLNFYFEGSGAVEVYLPSTLIYLGARAFAGSNGIKKVVVPETNGSFEIRPDNGYNTILFGNSGATLDLPSTTTQLVNAMFNGNNTVSIFILRATTPPSVIDTSGNTSTSMNNAGSIDLYVPDNYVSIYLSTAPYSSFSHVYGLSLLPSDYSQVPASDNS